MYLTGFADEAAASIDEQIRITKEMGWSNIESRNIEGKNLHDISEEKFSEVLEKTNASGVKINCFGSAIANWSKNIKGPFDETLEEAKRAIDRMKRLGSSLIRIMSYPVITDSDDQMEDERFRRLSELTKMFSDAGLTPVHENCMNYGGMSYQHTIKLLENVPGLKLVFDTGNPVASLDYSKPKPHPFQSSWEFYSEVKESIAYVHIKDVKRDPEGKKHSHTYPGEGDGDVEKIVADLIENGYDGGFSMEPHMAMVAHDPSAEKEYEESPEEIYKEYGKRFMAILAKNGVNITS